MRHPLQLKKDENDDDSNKDNDDDDTDDLNETYLVFHTMLKRIRYWDSRLNHMLSLKTKTQHENINYDTVEISIRIL